MSTEQSAKDEVQRPRRKRQIDFRVYLITDRKIFSDDTDAMLGGLEKALEGGVKAVQLREKDLETRKLLKLAYEMKTLTIRYGADLFINDRVDIALAVEADGVHLGGSSLSVAAVRKVAGEELFIGVSTHNIEEAVAAWREGADFLTFGPVFDTPSKRAYGSPVGLARLAEASKGVPLPVFAIGGVKQENIKDIKASGAFGAALISGILASENIKESSINHVRAIL